TFDQMDAAEEALQAAGINFSRTGRRLLVREKDKYSAVRVLNSSDTLPEDFEFGFAKLLEDDSTFKPSSVLEHQRKVALGYELAKVIASSPVVEHAFVLVQQQNRRSIGQLRVVPSASVKITMRGGHTVTGTIVEGCAKLVSTAVAGLSPHNVTVFDTKTLKAHKVPNPDEALASGLLDERKKYEKYLQERVLGQLSYIRGVLAAVSVELDGAQARTESFSYAEGEVKSEETKTSRSGKTSNSGEPGVNPNVGAALGGGGGGVQSETEDARTENYEPKLRERRVQDTPAFALKRATAAISIPRSHVAGVLTARNPDLKDVRDTDREFINARDEVLAGVRDAVMIILQAKNEADVQVDIYHDSEPGEGLLAAMPGGEGGGAPTVTTTEMFKAYLPQLGMGGLALLSLTMMMMMVRKTSRSAHISTPTAEDPTDEFSMAPDGMLTVSGGPVGQAEPTEGFLVGQEVDEATLQHSQLDEQVARLVDDDPEGVADLLRRWVEQSE
ncbi:MAG: hypothetical protein GY842_17605, partial [bacterium]|nr:hypothetical protein [bacterium]